MRWVALVVLGLVLVGGCSFADRSPSERRTLSPAPVPTTAASPDTDSDLPPGITRTGITNLSALVNAHVRVSNATRWAWVETTTSTVRTENRTVSMSTTQTVTFVDRRTYRHSADVWVKQHEGSYRYREGYERYANGSEGYATWLSSDPLRRVYRRDESPTVDDRFAGFATDPIRRYLSLDSTTVSRVGDADPQHYEVAGTQSNVSEYGPVTEYRARAVVRADGFVKRLNVSYTVEQSDMQVAVEYTFTYRRIGTATVERPAWVAAARNRTA